MAVQELFTAERAENAEPILGFSANSALSAVRGFWAGAYDCKPAK
jgi:hypothetical protein